MRRREKLRRFCFWNGRHLNVRIISCSKGIDHFWRLLQHQRPMLWLYIWTTTHLNILKMWRYIYVFWWYHCHHLGRSCSRRRGCGHAMSLAKKRWSQWKYEKMFELFVSHFVVLSCNVPCEKKIEKEKPRKCEKIIRCCKDVEWCVPFCCAVMQCPSWKKDEERKLSSCAKMFICLICLSAFKLHF